MTIPEYDKECDCEVCKEDRATRDRTCILYLERRGFESYGLGWCLGEHDEKGNCKLCDDVISLRCPRKHTSPYLREGEKDVGK